MFSSIKKGNVVAVSLAFVFVLLLCVFATANMGFCEDANIQTTLKVARYISITAPTNLAFTEDLMPGVEKVHTLQFTIQSSDHTNFSVTVTDFTREYTNSTGNQTGETGKVNTFFDLKFDGVALLTNVDIAQINALVIPAGIGMHSLEIVAHATANMTNQAGTYTSTTTVHGEYSI